MKLSWLSRSLINQWYRLGTKEVEDLHLDLTQAERELCFISWRGRYQQLLLHVERVERESMAFRDIVAQEGAWTYGAEEVDTDPRP